MSKQSFGFKIRLGLDNTETFYGVCNKHCEILNDEKPCEDFEEGNQ